MMNEYQGPWELDEFLYTGATWVRFNLKDYYIRYYQGQPGMTHDGYKTEVRFYHTDEFFGKSIDNREELLQAGLRIRHQFDLVRIAVGFNEYFQNRHGLNFNMFDIWGGNG